MRAALLVSVLTINCANNGTINYVKRIITQNLSGQVIKEAEIVVKQTPSEKLEQISTQSKKGYFSETIKSVQIGNNQFIYYDGELYKIITYDPQTGCKVERRASIVDYFEAKTCNGIELHHVSIQGSSALEMNCNTINNKHSCVTKENGHYFSSEASYFAPDHSIFTGLTPRDDEMQYDMFSFRDTPNGRKTETFWISLSSSEAFPLANNPQWRKTGEYIQAAYIPDIREFGRTERFEYDTHTVETIDLF